MKKLLILTGVIISMISVGCEPMEEINDQINTDLSVSGAIDYTLTDEDYEELDLNYGNFNSIADAKEILPEFLSNKYPVWGKGSLANVSFKVYAPKQDEKSLIVYEATNDDYDMYGDDDYANFDATWQVVDLIEDKFSDAPNRTLVSITYDYYSGGTSEVNNGYLLLDGEWVMIPGITLDEYNLMGESYDNFSSEDEAEEKLPIFLKETQKYGNPKAGEIKPIMYKLYTDDVDDIDGDGKTDDNATYSYVKYFIYDGMSWSVYNNTVVESVQFGHDGTTWVPDNTIQYMFTTEDYSLVASGLMDTYPSQAGNLDSYGNFNRSGGATSWTDEMMLAGFNIVLDNLDPNAEVGQKYVLTYVIYAGGYTNETKAVIKDENGDWVYQD
ncbi:MAG: hypothetical protein WB492_12980 [Christiangramia sp.]